MRLFQLPVPGLSQLQHYQGVREITVAHLMAVIMGLAVACLSDKLLEMHLFGLEYADQINVVNYVRVLTIVGTVVAGSDVVLFYRGVSEQGFLDSGGGLSAVMITVTYVGVMAFVTFIHVMLKRDLRNQE